MFEVGAKVRVREGVSVASEGIGGHIGTVKDSEPLVDETLPEGATAYLVLFDDDSDKGWIHWLSDLWLNDYELEAIGDGPH